MAMSSTPKFTPSTLQVLRFLLRRQHAYGLEIVQATGLLSGTAYPILKRLENAKWVTSQLKEVYYLHVGRRVQRHYTLTELGKSTIQKRLDTATQQQKTGLPQKAGIASCGLCSEPLVFSIESTGPSNAWQAWCRNLKCDAHQVQPQQSLLS